MTIVQHPQSQLRRWSTLPPWRVMSLYVLLLWCVHFMIQGTRNLLLRQDTSSPLSSSSLSPLSGIAMQTLSLLGEQTSTTTPLASSSTSSSAPFCTASQRKAIEIALPDNRNRCSSSENPWVNGCSITKKTGCPDPSWLHSHYQKYNLHNFHATSDEASPTKASAKSPNFLAINIGCNKGFDAITYLRMGFNNNESISKAQWRQYMPQNLQPGVCGQEDNEYKLPPIMNHTTSSRTATFTPSASVLCVEPMTLTFNALQSAASHFPGFHVLKYAVNNEKDSNVTFFPKHATAEGGNAVGAEKQSSDNCYNSRPARQAALMKHCEPIPTTRLDPLLQQEGYDQNDVHILLIDVEGWDYEVLKGGMQTLRRTHYLEFEYNWRGMWGHQKDNRPLFQAISTLNEMHFTCYWAGQQKLWLITNCWFPHYDGVFWSNVVCVNRVLSPVLAQSMNQLFLDTIQDS